MKPKKESAWQQVMLKLPADVSDLLQLKPSLLRTAPPYSKEYEEVYGLLPADVQDALPTPASEEDMAVDKSAAAYFLVVSDPDSGVIVNRFRNCTALAAHMGSREGDDIYAVPIYGVVLPYTMGPKRLLFAGDDNTAITIPMHGEEPTLVSNIHASDYQLQYDFYIGPAYLLGDVYIESPYDEEVVEPPRYGDDEDDNDDDKGEGSVA